MTATLPDRDAHTGAAADARADRLAEHAARVAWVASQHDATGQLGTIARMLDDYRTTDRARVVPLYDADGDVLLVYQQVSDLIDQHEAQAAEIQALRAQNARLLSQTPYSEDHRAALRAVYAKRAPVAQERAA